MDLGLKDKIALVAGASRGLGAATAKELAREGAAVIMCSRNARTLVHTQEEIFREHSGRAPTMVVEADLTRDEDVARLISMASARFGRLDILVTNCGGPPSGRFEDHNLDAWRKAVILMSTATDRELLDAGLPMTELIWRLYHEDAPEAFPARHLEFGCRCSRQRIVNVLRSFPREEIAEMKTDEGQVVVKCEFCGTQYAGARTA